MRAKSSQFGAKYLPPSPFAKLELGPFEFDSGRFDKRIDHFRSHPELRESWRNVTEQKSEPFNSSARRELRSSPGLARTGSVNVAGSNTEAGQG